ncbi:MAG: peptidase [Planctomycetota bacterium]|nr:MAG: peptidase [Planctomycetota bacterium]
MATRRKKRSIEIDDLYRIAITAHPRVSPDGKQLVFVHKTVGDKQDHVTNLWMVSTRAGASSAKAFTSGGRDSRPEWSPDGSQLAFVRSGEHGGQVALMSVDGGEARTLTDFPEGDVGALQWCPGGERLLVTFRARAEEWTSAAVTERKSNGRNDPPRVIDDPSYRLDGDGYFNAQRFALYEVSVDTGEHRLVYDKDRTGHFSFDVSPDGKRVALTTNRHKHAFAKEWTTEVALLDLATRKLSVLPGQLPGAKMTVRWSPDGKRLAWAGLHDEDGTRGTCNYEVWVADARRGRAKNIMAGNDRCLVAPTLGDSAEVEFAANLRWTPDSKRLVMQIGWQGAQQIHSIAATGGELRQHTSGKACHYLGNLSDDGKQLSMVVESATRPGEVAIGNLPRAAGTLRARTLTDVNGELFAQLQVCTPTSKWVRSADGSRVQVWTLLPPGSSSTTKRATVVEVHGGPQAQYGYTFFHEFQVLAAQGYAVVYGNPRGSKGYGEVFCRGIHHAWGTKDWEDMQAIIADMREQSFCDTKRMGFTGGSFGGYMTLWAIGHTNEFAAAIADRCVANMVSMWGASDIYIWPGSYLPGNTWNDTGALWEMSPLKHLGNARTPTLLIHSEGDLRCNVAESEQAYSALVMQGVPARFVRYPRNTSHGMSRSGPPDMRAHRLAQNLEWWTRWLRKKR